MNELDIEIETQESKKYALHIAIGEIFKYNRSPEDKEYLALADITEELHKVTYALDVLNALKKDIASNIRINEANPDQINFMIGQRVLYQDVICTVVPPVGSKFAAKIDEFVLLDNPERGYIHYANISNVKPYPMDSFNIMNKLNQICPMCEEGILTPTTHTIAFEHGVVVEGLEVSICNLCKSELVFPEQSKKNQVKIADKPFKETEKLN